MKGHLTKRDLIEYQFKLADDAKLKELAEHLDGCASCREELARLKDKFSALDMLREDVTASEELISQVVAQAGARAAPRVTAFRRPAWFRAVAAVLVLGLALLFAAQFGQEPMPRYEPLQELPGPPEEPQPSRDKILPRARAEKETAPLRPERSRALAEAEKETFDKLRPRRARVSPAEEISEQPPFAPASAIELVTLPQRDKVQLTIYNSADLTLVRERRNLTLKRGWNWLQFMWANTLIDPTSLSLEPLEQADKIDIDQLVFPARLRELGRWLIRSEVSGQVPFEITYLTSRLSWRAFYMGTLGRDEKTMRLQGYVRVGNSSGEDYENAQTRLIVGKVHLLDQIAELAKRQYPYGRPVGIRGYGMGGMGGYGDKQLGEVGGEARAWYGRLDAQTVTAGLGRKEIRKEGLSEYFLYTIEGTETVPDKWGKRLLSLEAEDIPVKGLYKYDEERWGGRTIRFLSFSNDDEHELGDTPIPDGTVRVYAQADSAGLLSYVGGTDIKYIPVDGEVELHLGPARLVTVEPKLMDFRTDNYRFDGKGNVAGWDEIRTWKIEVTNTRALPIEIEITRGFGTAYWTLQTDAPYEKHDVTRARFETQLQPRSKRTFGYQVRTYHGVREQALSEE
jgi:hypothetical protein